MHIELNIGLNVSGGDNSPAAVVRRALKAEGLLNLLLGPNAVIRCGVTDVPYEGPNGDAVETTLVVTLAGHVPRTTPKNVIYDLAVQLEQDCIAAYDAELEKGVLVGPKASEWGNFNPEFFIRAYTVR